MRTNFKPQLLLMPPTTQSWNRYCAGTLSPGLTLGSTRQALTMRCGSTKSQMLTTGCFTFSTALQPLEEGGSHSGRYFLEMELCWRPLPRRVWFGFPSIANRELVDGSGFGEAWQLLAQDAESCSPHKPRSFLQTSTNGQGFHHHPRRPKCGLRLGPRTSDRE